MKLVLAIGVLIAMLGGCAVVPLGYGYSDDGHYHRGDGYHHRDRYDGGGHGYRTHPHLHSRPGER